MCAYTLYIYCFFPELSWAENAHPLIRNWDLALRFREVFSPSLVLFPPGQS